MLQSLVQFKWFIASAVASVVYTALQVRWMVRQDRRFEELTRVMYTPEDQRDTLRNIRL